MCVLFLEQCCRPGCMTKVKSEYLGFESGNLEIHYYDQ